MSMAYECRSRNFGSRGRLLSVSQAIYDGYQRTAWEDLHHMPVATCGLPGECLSGDAPLKKRRGGRNFVLHRAIS